MWTKTFEISDRVGISLNRSTKIKVLCILFHYKGLGRFDQILRKILAKHWNLTGKKFHTPPNETNSYLFLQIAYRQKHDAAKGVSDYAHMKEPPEIQHAMEVTKHQSNVSRLFLMIFWKTVVNSRQGYWISCWSLNVTTLLFKKDFKSFFLIFISPCPFISTSELFSQWLLEPCRMPLKCVPADLEIGFPTAFPIASLSWWQCSCGFQSRTAEELGC